MKDQNRIKILPFEPDRTREVIDLILSIQRGEFGIPITEADQPDLGDIPGFYRRGTGNFWTACQGNRVVGTIALIDIGEHRAALRKMFVHKDFRGREKGTAGALLETLLAWARQKDLREIFLGTTPKFLAAHRFYEKTGFEEIGEADLPGAFPIMAVDKKFYRYALSPEPGNLPGPGHCH